jgi:hypothetical protein
MVYCTKCGTKNLGVEKICSNCGAALTYQASVPQRRPVQPEQVYRVISISGLVLGIIIVLAGLIWVLQQADLIPSTIEVWPFAAIIIGLFLIIGAIRGVRREY